MTLHEHDGGILKDPFKEPMDYRDIADVLKEFTYRFHKMGRSCSCWSPRELEGVSVKARKELYSELVKFTHSLGDLEYALREWSELPVKGLGETPSDR